ncbi:39S ribosomal protein L54, mitochondrial [Bicyclus anynana]|uniref:Large ribosomal subunit protein mL54 n=1 Tax=Bicyclus anynana TaxID=110368 RepID=A0A6J1P0I6_BICAN|nr:39S ribosomal protein L54, mitochondrial [Bicyclus anynana]
MSKMLNVLQTCTKILPQISSPQITSCNNWLSKACLHTNSTNYAVKKTTTAAGGVLGLGKGKKKISKLGSMEKKQLPVETDPERLVNYVCGSNIYITGEDVKIKDDSEYPDWLWTLNTGKPPRIEDLDPNTKQYWLRVRAAGMRRNNKLRSMRKF